jgi:hypothetical protein
MKRISVCTGSFAVKRSWLRIIPVALVVFLFILLMSCSSKQESITTQTNNDFRIEVTGGVTVSGSTSPLNYTGSITVDDATGTHTQYVSDATPKTYNVSGYNVSCSFTKSRDTGHLEATIFTNEVQTENGSIDTPYGSFSVTTK